MEKVKSNERDSKNRSCRLDEGETEYDIEPDGLTSEFASGEALQEKMAKYIYSNA